MQKNSPPVRLRRIHRLVGAFCGLYSRVASRLKRDRSYVSRVARGERRSQEVEHALLSEFDRIQREELGQQNAAE